MSKEPHDVWQNCLKIIKTEVNPQSFKTWFEPIKPLRLDGNVLTIQVPNKFFYEWLEEHYVALLKRSIQLELGADSKLEYLIPRRQPNTSAVTPVQPTISKDLERNYGQQPIRSEQIKNPFVIPGLQKAHIDSQLNPDYTFDNFVEGDCNRLARSAGWAIGKRPGQTAFNPLTIFGETGLGKTHLAHAIGNEVRKLQPDKTVLYVATEKFTTQFIDSMKNNALNDFTLFYQMVDVLIMDDIQFLSNKLKTQDIFFHIFNNLHQSGKQLILTSDRPPKELEGMEERLLSRFKWGLAADLQVPSLETRMAIIQQKMEQDGIDIPHNVTEFLSYNVRSNIRELEGVLISLIAQAALNQREIDIELAKEVIGKVVTDISNELSVEFVLKVVAEYYKINPKQLKDKNRTKIIAIARQVSMYLAKQLCNKSLAEIGRTFGGRDHTTVLHACRTVEEMLQTDAAMQTAIQDLETKIKSVMG